MCYENKTQRGKICYENKKRHTEDNSPKYRMVGNDVLPQLKITKSIMFQMQ